MSAIVNVYELHPHIGSVWRRFCELWAGYVGNTALTLSTGTGTTSVGSGTFKTVTIGFDDGTTNTIYSLIDSRMTFSKSAPIAYPMQCEGWYSMPPPTPYQTGARVTITDWDSNCDGIRDSIWSSWCGASVGAPGSVTYTTPVANMKTFLRYKPVHLNYEVTMDYTSVFVWDTTGAIVPTTAMGVEVGGRTTPSVVVGAPSGGGSIDLSAVVAALQDIATQDVEYIANQGGAIWSMRGKVRVP